VIIRKAIDSLRKNRKFPCFEEDLDELVTYSKHGFLNAPMWAAISNPEEEILKSEGLTQVEKALDALNDVHRIPVLLKDFEGFTIKEISALLDISESNVKVRIHRGRIKLSSELRDYFFPDESSGST
jgi:RNA polymerase sigma factor (sigma-70 family)